jgi:hypothetical protein
MTVKLEETYMATIIAGMFQQQESAQDAVGELLHAGFAGTRISSFYLSPFSVRDVESVGHSRGAKESYRGEAGGAAAGAAVGAAAASVLGPVGTVTGGLVGAHVGGMVGTMSKMKEQGDTGEHAEDPENAMPIRHSGMMVAVEVEDAAQEEQAIHLLRSLGATDLERTAGSIVDGDWTDFDPNSVPDLIGRPAGAPETGIHRRF